MLPESVFCNLLPPRLSAVASAEAELELDDSVELAGSVEVDDSEDEAGAELEVVVSLLAVSEEVVASVLGVTVVVEAPLVRLLVMDPRGLDKIEATPLL